MKNFLIKTSLFLVFPILIYLSIFNILKLIVTRDISKHTILILGDSQTEFLNLPNAYNHSIDGSPYFVQYSFVKSFESVIKDKRIYIAYNYHHFSKLYQNRLENDSLFPGWSFANIKRINTYNILNLYKYNEINEDIKLIESGDIKKIIKFKDRILPKHNKNSLSIVSDTTIIWKAINRHFFNSHYIKDDLIQHFYLNKLIKLLVQNGNEVFLLKMPVTNFYKNRVPNSIKSELKLITKVNNLKLIDLHQILDLQNDFQFFKDYGHLNKKGDSIVINYFIKEIL